LVLGAPRRGQAGPVRYRGRVWTMGAERVGRAAVTVIENTSLSRKGDW
jgi:hypothetical protein